LLLQASARLAERQGEEVPAAARPTGKGAMAEGSEAKGESRRDKGGSRAPDPDRRVARTLEKRPDLVEDLAPNPTTQV